MKAGWWDAPLTRQDFSLSNKQNYFSFNAIITFIGSSLENYTSKQHGTTRHDTSTTQHNTTRDNTKKHEYNTAQHEYNMTQQEYNTA